MAIESFADEDLEEFFWHGKACRNKGWFQLGSIAKRKLDILHFAKDLLDLRSPPNNRLEALKGNLKGYYSIRINDQWRIIFQWAGQPCNVKIVDYH